MGADGVTSVFHDRYFAALLLCVAAYAVFGKGFAYAGVPPFFPAEAMLFIGLVTLLYPRPSAAVLFNGPVLVLAVAIGWTVLRMLPYLGVYGLDAARDAVVLVYGLFALVMANLILEDPSRIDRAIGWAARFFALYAIAVVPLYVFNIVLGDAMPRWPVSGAFMMQLRGGEASVHVAGAAVFALLGFTAVARWQMVALVVSIAFLCALSRGGMLSILLPLGLAALLAGRIRPMVLAGIALVPVLTALYVADVEIRLPGVERSLQVAQMIDNIISVVGASGDEGLDGTKEWRLEWWSDIVAYTVHGPHFWTGKGFGVNLAVDDGYTLGLPGPALRSPHNGHMTILARAGVPGLALWVVLLGLWATTMIARSRQAARAGHLQWSRLFVFLLCYLASALVNASFDVALEGPMIGVVFWVLFGAGVGASMVYGALAPARTDIALPPLPLASRTA